MNAQAKLEAIAMDLIKIDLQIKELGAGMEEARVQLNEFAKAVSNYINKN